jgi:hypothetical protein
LIKYYGFGFAKGIIVIIGFFMIAVPGILLILQGMIIAGGVLLGIFVLLLVLITIIFSAMSTIYDTALFMYADTGTVSTFFSAEELKSAFVPKRR